MLTIHEETERVIFNFYNGLLGTSLHQEYTINLEELKLPLMILLVWKTLSEEEVWRTISDLPSGKAPGPMVL